MSPAGFAEARDSRTLVELALKHERIVLAVLIAILLLSWTWIALMAIDMYGSMSGTSAWMMTAHWDAAHVLLLFTMWAVMMVAMMLPSAAPLVLLYAGALRASRDPAARASTYAIAAGYLAVWLIFSAVATLLQRMLSSVAAVDAMMEPSSSALTAAILVLAGVYQLTPLKRSCLRVCRSPLGYLMQHWRQGTRGAFGLGLRHGVYCLGCCWALMLLLFAGGIMNLLVIAALTLWVLAEKFAPLGEQGARRAA
ncbi:MAG TPA: DUF2182 domain-containing protein [Casimicrobiaceae bacterium]|nr:DUF2182 domain-containing protein [Casimicrobiaceae bacterium]